MTYIATFIVRQVKSKKTVGMKYIECRQSLPPISWYLVGIVAVVTVLVALIPS
jgi:hypothetical protein